MKSMNPKLYITVLVVYIKLAIKTGKSFGWCYVGMCVCKTAGAKF